MKIVTLLISFEPTQPAFAYLKLIIETLERCLKSDQSYQKDTSTTETSFWRQFLLCPKWGKLYIFGSKI